MPDRAARGTASARLLTQAGELLKAGRIQEAGTAAYQALKESSAEDNPARCDSYLLLGRCAELQGDLEAALNFALSARITALESADHRRGFEATVHLTELCMLLGPLVPEVLERIALLYRPHGLDIFRFLPEGLARQS